MTDSDDDKLLSRRQVLGIFGASTGAAIIGGGQANLGSGDGQGNLYGGAAEMAAPYKIGERMWKGPISVLSEIPEEDGNDFMQTDAGDNNDQYALHHYNGGWSKQGLDTKSVTTEHVGNVTWASSYETLQAAIDDAAANDNNFVIVDGKYKISNPPLTIPSGMKVLGSAPTAGTYDSLVGSAIVVGTDTSVTNLVEIVGEGSSLPAQTTIQDVMIWGGSNVTNCLKIPDTAHSLRIRDCYIRNGTFGIDVAGAGIDIDSCEINKQSGQGIHFSDPDVRGITVRNSWFEGQTQGFFEFEPTLAYKGYIHIFNNRLSMHSVPASQPGIRGYIGANVENEFNLKIERNHFFEWKAENQAILLDPGGTANIGGPIEIIDNEFVAYDRDTDVATGERAIQVSGEIQPSIKILNNDVRGFVAPANQPMNIKNTKATLTVGDNTGQAIFDNGGTATLSGDGTTTAFTVNHGLQYAPSRVNPTPDLSTAATPIDGVQNITASSFDVVFSTAPASGTDNIGVMWEASYV